MNDIRLNIADVDFSQDAETREARHELLASFLGAFADGELPAETQSQIDAHLTGCARCRRELDVHRALRDRLSKEPVPAATAMLRARIAAGIRLAPPPTLVAAVPVTVPPATRSPSRTWALAALAVVLTVTLLLSVREWRVRTNAQSAVSVAPTQSAQLFGAVLTDYRRVAAGELPGRARDLEAVRAAVPFTFTTLPNTSLRLVGAWTTSLLGEPAVVLAYRFSDNRVVYQYFVTEALLFQSPVVRASLAQRLAVSVSDGGQSMLLWAEPEYGSVLVGEFSPAEFTAMRDITKGR